jgi:peptidoglycan/LPS O-acetylase OafA/YrhL
VGHRAAAEIPSLYGIRAIAALAVVISHADLRIKIGGLAVTCFFVLSGYLITHLLLRERSQTGTVSLKQFYFRRTLRIFPAFWAFAGVYLILSLVAGRHVDWLAYAAIVLYAGNYWMAVNGLGATMNHTWSLAVEEQFYLLWPAIFRLADPRRLVRWLAGAIVGVWVYRSCALWLGAPWEYVYVSFETRLDGLAVGCLMALALHARMIPTWLVRVRWLAIAAAVAVAGIRLIPGLPVWLGYILAPPAFAVLILHAVTHHDSYAYRWLNAPVIRTLGLWSYSLYLYHPLSDDITRRLGDFGFMNVPIEVAVSIALAAGSYYMIERPVLMLRDRTRRRQQRPVAAAA